MKHLDEGTLQAWLDSPRSGLDTSEMAHIERHLAECEACAAALETVRTSDEQARSFLASGLDRDVPRPPFEDVVARARRTSRRGLRRLNRMAWAASIVVALGVGWMTNEIYRGGGPEGAVQPVLVRPESSEAEVAAEFVPEEAVATEDTPSAPPPEVASNAEPAVERDRAAEPARAAPDIVADADAPTAPAVDVAAGTPPPAAADAGAGTAFGARQRVGTAASATSRAVVSGVIRDGRSGEPIPSAQVYVDELPVGTLSQEDGSYSLVIPEDAADSTELDLVAVRIGYRTERREVSLSGGDPLTADFNLEEEALELEEVAVTGTAGVAQGRALGGAAARMDDSLGWREAARSEAESVLDGDLRLVPGLAVQTIELSPVGGTSSVVRVRQALESGATLTLVQGRADDTARAWPIPPEGAVESRRVGELLITGTAPVSADSLRALLDALR